MQALDQPYLGTYQGAPGRGALIADAGAARWENLDEAALAKLAYSANRYSAWGPDAPVHKGAVFAVRTAEGNLAKVRIAEIGEDYRMRLEWLLYLVEEKVPEQETIVSSPWLASRDEALAAYKAQRFQEALDACGKAIEAAEKAGEAHRALALVTCGGLMSLHRRAARQME